MAMTEDEGHMIDAALMAGFTIIPSEEGTAFTCTKEDIIALMTPWHEQNKARKAEPAVPPEWRKFVEDCAKTAGGMVNGNNLAQLAEKLLAAAPAPQFETAADLAAWLDTLHETEGGAITNRKWEVAQIAIAAITAPADPSVAQAIHYPQCWDTAAYPTVKSALAEVHASFHCSECNPQPHDSAAELYAALRGMHWHDGKLAVVNAKDLKLGVQTYSGALLDEAIRATLPPQKDSRSLAIHDWFGLTYAQFLTLPRVIMEAMPARWQEQMVALLDELGETYDYLPANGNMYYVRVGQPAEWPYEKTPPLKNPDRDLCNYRHPNIWHRKKNRNTYLGTPDKDEVPKPESPDRG